MYGRPIRDELKKRGELTKGDFFLQVNIIIEDSDVGTGNRGNVRENRQDRQETRDERFVISAQDDEPSRAIKF